MGLKWQCVVCRPKHCYYIIHTLLVTIKILQGKVTIMPIFNKCFFFSICQIEIHVLSISLLDTFSLFSFGSLSKLENILIYLYVAYS